MVLKDETKLPTSNLIEPKARNKRKRPFRRAPSKDSDLPAYSRRQIIILRVHFWIDKDAMFLHADGDHTARMRRPIQVFFGRTRQKVLFLTLWHYKSKQIEYAATFSGFWSDLRRNIRQCLILRRHNHSTTTLVKNKFHGTVLCLIFLNNTSDRIHVWCASALIIYKELSGTSLSQVVFHIFSLYTFFWSTCINNDPGPDLFKS